MRFTPSGFSRLFLGLVLIGGPALGQGLLSELRRGVLPEDIDDSWDAVLVDIDGDKDLDLVVANGIFTGKNQNRLYRNDGAGGFVDVTSKQLPRDSVNASAVVAGDVDGDGDADLVFANRGNGGTQNRLYLNDGRGTFRDVTSTQLPQLRDDSYDLVLVDVDGDKDLDLVVANTISGVSTAQNRLLLNNGRGSFVDATNGRMPVDKDSPQALAAGDFDGDGDADLVFANGGRGERLYLNDGKGTFTDRTKGQLPPTTGISHGIAVGDVDGDGDLDIAFALSGDKIQNRLYLGDGKGKFVDATSRLLPQETVWTRDVTLGDIDGDKDLDLIYANGTNYTPQQNSVLVNDGKGRFVDRTSQQADPERFSTTTVVLGDADRDGDLDCFAINEQSRLGGRGDYGGINTVAWNDGRGRFVVAPSSMLPPDDESSTAVAVADFDGDGDLDMVIGNEPMSWSRSGQNRLYYNDGNGRFTEAPASALPADKDYTYDIATGDLDGDGDIDLLLASHYGGQNRLYLNDGRGRFIDATANLPKDKDWSAAIALADFDGDGDLDAYWASGLQDKLYLNNGRGSFVDASSRLPRETENGEGVVAADLDGDKDIDLFVANSPLWSRFGGYTGGQNFVLLNDGKGNFTNATSSAIGAYRDISSGIDAGDVDGDGDVDIAIANLWNTSSAVGSPNVLWLNDGRGRFVRSTALPLTKDWAMSVAFVDLDNDRAPDLLFGNYGRNHAFLNRGGGRFTDGSNQLLPADVESTRQLALGDLDRDGDLDVVLATARGAPSGRARVRNRLYQNLLRQVHAPLPARVGQPYPVEFFAAPGLFGFGGAIGLMNLSAQRPRLRVAPYGLLGVGLNNIMIGTPLGIGAQGKVRAPFAIPNVAALAGQSLHLQALVFPSIQPSWRLSNLLVDPIGR